MELKPSQPKPRTIEDAWNLMRTAKGWGMAYGITFRADGYLACREMLYSDLPALLGYLDRLQPSKTVTITLSREDAEALSRNFRISSPAGHRCHDAIKKALEQQ